MSNIRGELKNCFRSDSYILGNKDTHEIDEHVEYFITTGDNSMIRIVDFYEGSCLIQLNQYVIEVNLHTEGDLMKPHDELISCYNRLHDMVMVYDYCLTELRKMSQRQAKKSPLFEVKTEIEDRIAQRYWRMPTQVKKDVISKLQKRCDFLSYAFDLERRGVVDFNKIEISKFKNLKQLQDYVVANNLEKNKMGKDKSVVVRAFGEICQWSADPLTEIRELSDELLFYRIHLAGPKLKGEKVLRLTEKKFDKELDKACQYLRERRKVQRKLMFDDNSAKKSKSLAAKEERLTKKIENASTHNVMLTETGGKVY